MYHVQDWPEPVLRKQKQLSPEHLFEHFAHSAADDLNSSIVKS